MELNVSLTLEGYSDRFGIYYLDYTNGVYPRLI